MYISHNVIIFIIIKINITLKITFLIMFEFVCVDMLIYI